MNILACIVFVIVVWMAILTWRTRKHKQVNKILRQQHQRALEEIAELKRELKNKQ